MTNQDKMTNGSSIFGAALLIEMRQMIREELQAVMKPSSLHPPYAQPRRINKPFLSVKEAAKMATLAPSTVRLYIRKGKLKANKVGRRMVIARGDLETFLTLNPTGVQHYIIGS